MIGKMDQRIALQREIATPDGIGGVTKAWSTFATVWARVAPVRGAEAVQEGRMMASELVKFTIYTRADVTELTRLVWNGTAFNVRNIPSDSPRSLHMDMIGERGVAS